ncbi:BtpA/SgcQ family protein [bacterium]|nr:BtpA/SgcQ family protein [bacterium]
MWSRDDLQTRIDPACIGMIHLDPLPGAPRYEGALERVVAHALADLEALTAGGVTAVMVENFHDTPFHPGRVPPETVAAMAVVAAEMRRAAPAVRLGVNVLRNDADAALGLAASVAADLIRVNVHTGSMVTDQGTLEGQAHRTLRRRRELGLDRVGILADLRVKHAAPLAARDLVDEARDLRLRGMADALIVSGEATGAPADPRALQAVRDALPDCPLLVGSGVTGDNVAELLTTADAVIVGTSLKGARGRIDPGRVRALVAVLAHRKEGS